MFKKSGSKLLADAARAPVRPRHKKPSIFKPDAYHHSLWEDVQGIIASVLLIALAIGLFQKLGLITSGLAGLAIVIHYASGWQTGQILFLLNLPFYVLAVHQLGWAFALKTFGAVTLLAVLIDLQSSWIVFETIDPVFGAVAGGVLMGFGVLGVFRHRGSLGGFGILSIWLQDKLGLRPGLVMMALDSGTFILAMFVAPWPLVAVSLLGALILNIFLAINHRTDRYVAV